MAATPYEALHRLRSAAATGELAARCVQRGVELLVAHGSALDDESARPARDLDLAFRFRHDVEPDTVAFVNEMLDITRFDEVDLMDLQRAGPVARARALGPRSLVLHEAVPGTFAEAQMAALTTEMETRWLRRLDLQLMAGR